MTDNNDGTIKATYADSVDQKRSPFADKKDPDNQARIVQGIYSALKMVQGSATPAVQSFAKPREINETDIADYPSLSDLAQNQQYTTDFQAGRFVKHIEAEGLDVACEDFGDAVEKLRLESDAPARVDNKILYLQRDSLALNYFYEALDRKLHEHDKGSDSAAQKSYASEVLASVGRVVDYFNEAIVIEEAKANGAGVEIEVPLDSGAPSLDR